MLVQNVSNNQLTISLSGVSDMFGVQRLIDYARYLEAVSGSQASQADVDKLADEVGSNWWNRNKHRFFFN